jgi:hypothetical protein
VSTYSRKDVAVLPARERRDRAPNCVADAQSSCEERWAALSGPCPPLRPSRTTAIVPPKTTTGQRRLVQEDRAAIAPAIDVTTAERTTIRSRPMTVRRDTTTAAVSVGSTRSDQIDVTESIRTIARYRMPMIEPDAFITEDRTPMMDPVKVFPGPIVSALASEESF